MVEQWVPLEIRGSTMVNHGHFIAQPWQEMVDNHGVTMVSPLSAMVEQWFFRRGTEATQKVVFFNSCL